MENVNWVSVFVFASFVLTMAYTIYRNYMERNGGKVNDKLKLKSYVKGEETYQIGKTSKEFDGIDESIVDEIRAIKDIKIKGDKLEDLVRDIYRMMGYKADTVRDLKARGKFPGLTGNDQGADVFVELIEKDPKTGANVLRERWVIQCKNYKNLDEEAGNDAVKEVYSAKDYYVKKGWYNKIDRAILITTSPRITIPALDLAKTHNVECFNANALKGLIKKAKTALHQRQAKTTKISK